MYLIMADIFHIQCGGDESKPEAVGQNLAAVEGAKTYSKQTNLKQQVITASGGLEVNGKKEDGKSATTNGTDTCNGGVDGEKETEPVTDDADSEDVTLIETENKVT